MGIRIDGGTNHSIRVSSGDAQVESLASSDGRVLKHHLSTGCLPSMILQHCSNSCQNILTPRRSAPFLIQYTSLPLLPTHSQVVSPPQNPDHLNLLWTPKLIALITQNLQITEITQNPQLVYLPLSSSDGSITL